VPSIKVRIPPVVAAFVSILCAVSCIGASTQALLDASFLSNAQGAATILTPANNAHFSREKQFLWTEMPNAFYYQLEISTNADFSGVVLRARTKSSRYVVADADLVGVSSLAQQVYYLRVITGYGSSEVVSVATQFVLFDTEIVYVNVSSSVVPIYGNLGAPFKKIQDGINYAAFNGKKRVHVAQGDYVGSITLANGISLYGAYDPAFTVQNTTTQETKIKNTTNIYSIQIGSDVTQTTTLDCFTVENNLTTGTLYSIYNESSAMIFSNNKIILPNTTIAIGLQNVSASPQITANTIQSSGTATNRGIVNSASSPTISNNTFTMASAASQNRGIVNETGSAPSITNNSFSLSGTNSSTSIAIDNNASPAIISNNTITFGTSGATSTHTGISSAAGSLASITGNTINLGNTNSANNYCILNNASATTVQNNTLNTGVNSTTYGIYNSSASGTISGNTVTTGTGGTNTGIYNTAASPTITANTLTITAANTTYGIHNTLNSSPTISNNNIRGGAGVSNNYGIYNHLSSNATISGNLIVGATATGPGYGIFNVTSAPTISNNMILGGAGSNNYGIYHNTSSAAYIYNNTINGGSAGNTAYGLYISNGSTPTIRNNVILASGATSRYCIFEADATSDPIHVENNNLFGCITEFYRDEGSTSVTNLITSVSTSASNTLQNFGNVNIDNTGNQLFVNINGVDGNIITLADNDWNLTTNAAICNVRGGGLTIAGITLDRAGSTRTTGNPSGGCTPTNAGQTGWSMGAYESD
jgi:hypothetical protein